MLNVSCDPHLTIGFNANSSAVIYFREFEQHALDKLVVKAYEKYMVILSASIVCSLHHHCLSDEF